MIRPFLKHALFLCLETFVVLITFIALLFGFIAWRLSEGPVSLNFLKENAENFFAQALEGERVSLDQLEAYWSPDERTVMIRGRDIKVYHEGEKAFYVLPLVQVDFSPEALLYGKIALSRLLVEGGSFSFIRRSDGAVALGFGKPDFVLSHAKFIAPEAMNNGQESRFSRLLFQLFARTPDPLSATGRLKILKMSNAIIYIKDEVTGLDWLVGDAVMTYERGRDASEAGFQGFLKHPGFDQSAPFSLKTRIGPDLQSLYVESYIEGASPRIFMPDSGQKWSWLKSLDAPVNASVSVNAVRGRGLLAADFSFDVKPGYLIFDENSPRLFSGAGGKAYYEPETGSIMFAEAFLNTETLSFQGKGRVWDIGDFLDSPFRHPMGYDIDLEKIRLVFDGMFEKALEADYVKARGYADVLNTSLIFENLEAQTKGVEGKFEGRVQLQTREDGKVLPDIRLSGPVTGRASVQTVLDHWPFGLDDAARNWVQHSVLEADAYGAHLDMDIKAENWYHPLPDKALSLSFEFDKGYVRYLKPMAPLEEARGRAELKGNSFTLEVDKGRLAGGKVTEGRVILPDFSNRQAEAEVSAHIEGKVQDFFAFLDTEPLSLLSQSKQSPEDFKGTGSFDFSLFFPVLNVIPEEKIRYEMKGSFQGFSAPGQIKELPLSKADLDFSLKNGRVMAQGHGQIGAFPSEFDVDIALQDDGNTPSRFRLSSQFDKTILDVFAFKSSVFSDGYVRAFIEGEGQGFTMTGAQIKLDLTPSVLAFEDWKKEEGQVGQAHLTWRHHPDGSYEIKDITAEAKGLRLKGLLRFGVSGQLKEIKIPVFRLGSFADLSLEGEKRGETLFAYVKGRYWDGRKLITSLLEKKKSALSSAAFNLSGSLERFRVTDSEFLDNLSFDLRYKEKIFEYIDIESHGQKMPLVFRLMSQEKGGRDFYARGGDAGLILRIFSGRRIFDGGAFHLQGFLPFSEGEPGMGALTLKDFTVKDAPVLAQLLSLASLKGLGDTLTGEGIKFEKLESSFTLSKQQILIRKTEVSGSAMGITVSGFINYNKKKLDLDGVIIPSYTLNSFLGHIPLLGDAFVSRKGEGVLGLTYSVEGPFKNPRVFVNPLSAFAPGILRRFFEGQRSLDRAYKDVSPLPEHTESTPARESSPNALPKDQKRSLEQRPGDQKTSHGGTQEQNP